MKKTVPTSFVTVAKVNGKLYQTAHEAAKAFALEVSNRLWDIANEKDPGNLSANLNKMWFKIGYRRSLKVFKNHLL